MPTTQVKNMKCNFVPDVYHYQHMLISHMFRRTFGSPKLGYIKKNMKCNFVPDVYHYQHMLISHMFRRTFGSPKLGYIQVLSIII